MRRIESYAEDRSRQKKAVDRNVDERSVVLDMHRNKRLDDAIAPHTQVALLGPA